MTCGYYRTSSPVTALPMIMRWISDVPSKIVKLLEVRAVSAGRRPAGRALVSTNSARLSAVPSDCSCVFLQADSFLSEFGGAVLDL